MEGSPTYIEDEWPGIPSHIDAAVFFEGYITLLSVNSKNTFKRKTK